MATTITKKALRSRRHARVRAKVSGTAERPRLAVFKSNKHLYAQVIDDTRGHTLVAASDATTGLSGNALMKAAVAIGTKIAGDARKQGITAIVFDKGGYPYAGSVKALADAAREGGLTF